MAQQEQPLEELRVAILATDGVEQIELTDPRATLEEAGALVDVVAPHGGSIQGMNHLDKGDLIPVDFALDETDAEQYDALVLPGGVFNADRLRADERALEFVRAFDRAQKPIAVICHGPWTLVSADLVRGRTLTSYHTIRDDIVNAGGQWVDQPVVVEGNWVSSRGPKDLRVFDERMIERFRRSAERRVPRAA
ncbi:MAG: type 1 glutamine amidotransferase [Armatimonadetes bacterium]|nr:type 1 glutamine amidotransferase [Armatimonadota bacterium]